MNDYHDYVIKNGKFIGQFEDMYQNCDEPWPESERDLAENPVSAHTVTLIKKNRFKKLFTIGSGKGFHADWLQRQCPGLEVEGCEVSSTAIEYSKKYFPHINTLQMDIKDFDKYKFDFDVILFREILWYILPQWDFVIKTLKKRYISKYIIIEISCYDNQTYGLEYFDGPDVIIKEFPFQIDEIVRHHLSPDQKEGMLLISAQIHQ